MAKPTQIIRRVLATNCLSVFDHFVGLALKELTLNKTYNNFFVNFFSSQLHLCKTSVFIFTYQKVKRAEF